MKTKLIRLFDYKEAPLEKEAVVYGIDEDVEKELHFLTRKDKKVVEVQSVQKGDIVTLGLQSSNTKFNRDSIKLSVGSKLFDAQLEEHIIGLLKNETKELDIKDCRVSVSVKKIERTVFPELTDEMVKHITEEKEDIETINSVEEYRKFLYNQFLEQDIENILQDKAEELILYIMEHSEWDYDDEIDTYYKEEMEVVQEDFKREGTTMETASDEMFRMYCDCNNLEEFKADIRESIKQQIVYTGLACAYGNTSFEEATFEDSETFDVFGFFKEYIRPQLKIIERKGE